MKPFLLHPDRDFDLDEAPPWNAASLVKDLELETLVAAMAGDDKLVRQVTLQSLLNGARNDVQTIRHRQAALRDALDNPAGVRDLYALTGEAIEGKRRRSFGLWVRHASSALYATVDLMGMFAGMLRRLRDLARAHSGRFASGAWTTMFAMLERELSDEYLARIERHLAALKFRDGTLMSARLGPGNAGEDYVLREPHNDQRSWPRRLLEREPAALIYRIADRDEAGSRALSELRDRGVFLVANALTGSSEHVAVFFQMLRAELAFYIGCLNLRERLAAQQGEICFPRPSLAGGHQLRCRDLYDPGLALQTGRSVVGNTVDADGKSLVILTGANRGGKSSFLRALGVAQLMMQAGMFVAAASFEGELSTGVVTHYKREEDADLKRGKFDEELARMSDVADHLRPNGMLLCNESFASTNEREASEIARQVVQAFGERGIKVLFVTHLHTFARGVFERHADGVLFLRAERLPDGTRTFRLIEGEPLATSYGEDLYRRIFG